MIILHLIPLKITTNHFRDVMYLCSGHMDLLKRELITKHISYQLEINKISKITENKLFHIDLHV